MFGEFCLLVSELREHYQRNIPNTSPRSQLKVKAIQQAYEEKNLKRKFLVFLGGSCNPTTWRQDIAIPYFKQHRITFYNPQVSNWRPELIEVEDIAKQTAEVLFFVIDNKTRSSSSMVEVSYLAGCGRQLILVMNSFIQPVIINGEYLHRKEVEDLQRSHIYLIDLVERMSIPVFCDIDSALKCTKTILHTKIKVSELTLQDGARPVKCPHIRVANEFMRIRDIFNTLDTTSKGTLDYQDVRHAFKTVTDEDLPADITDKIFSSSSSSSSSLTFDEFCCLLSEYRYKKKDITHRLVSGLVRLPQRLTSWMRGETDSLVQDSVTWRRDVFLGGSCGGTRWRDDLAIPILLKHGVSYYNPQLDSWDTHYIPIEATVKRSCRLLLFVITADTHAITSMIEAAYFIGQSCNVVLCIQEIKPGTSIYGQQISECAMNDYNRARAYLSDLANREGVPVLRDVTEAVTCVVRRLKSHITPDYTLLS